MARTAVLLVSLLIALTAGCAADEGSREPGSTDPQPSVVAPSSVATVPSPAATATTAATTSTAAPAEACEQVDSASGFALSAVIPIGDSYIFDLAQTADGVWVTTEAGLHRIDPDSGDVELVFPLTIGMEAILEHSADVLWLAEGSTIHRLDIVSSALEVSTHTGQAGIAALGVAGESLWIASGEAALRLELPGMTLTEEVELGSEADSLVAGAGSVWVLVDQGLVRLDAATGEVLAEIAIPPETLFHPSIGPAIWFGGGTPWIGMSGLARIDPATNAVLPVVDDPYCCGPTAVGFVGDQPLAYGLIEGSLVAVDPQTGELTPIAESRMGVFSISGDDDGFWAAVNRMGVVCRFDRS